MADPAHLTKLVRQHAATAKLLGVDFVPAYRTVSDEPVVASDRPVVVVQPVSAPAHTPTRTVKVEVATSEPDASHTPTTAPGKPRGDLRTWVRPVQEQGESDGAYKARALAALQAKYEADAPHLAFVTDHHNVVFGDGDPASPLVFVGEAPGEEEDTQGKPFVGRSGQLLNKMIGAMGTSREQVYICNVLKTRPPGNATPGPAEIALCEPYLFEQLAILKPHAIVTLGLPASRTLLKTDESMAKLRNQWRTLKLPDGTLIPVMPTYHPAYLLRAYNEENRVKVWSDLYKVAMKLGLKPTAKAPPGASE
jgi:uracil-DNA glycosylase